MSEQIGFMHLLELAGVAVATVVAHAWLKKKGQLVLAILSSLAGLGIMIYIVSRRGW
ncbi:MAG: hypothetical protein ACOY30_03865 [Bacillota bacterium]